MAANSLDLTWTTGDAAGNYITVTSGTSYLVLFKNTHATVAKTVTITSVADDPFLRTGDITSYSLSAAEYGHYYFSATAGWKDGSNHIVITPETTDIKFMVITF